jgi:hypothetical protein
VVQGQDQENGVKDLVDDLDDDRRKEHAAEGMEIAFHEEGEAVAEEGHVQHVFGGAHCGIEYANGGTAAITHFGYPNPPLLILGFGREEILVRLPDGADQRS